MVFGKTRLRQGAFWYETGGVFWRLLVRKGGPNGAFLKIMKIENDTQNQQIIRVRHLYLPETPPRAVLKNDEKTMKSDRKVNGFLWSKSFEKY